MTDWEFWSAFSRRSLMKGILASGAALALQPLFGPGVARAGTGRRRADEVLKDLMEGNARFVSGSPHSFDQTSVRKELKESQSPDVIILRCADSRVSPEIVFDQSLGALFVCAVAGNIATPEVVASMEYSVANLGSSLIVVMGHSKCGAVDATLKNYADTDALPGSLPGLVNQILPAVLKKPAPGADPLAAAIRTNAELTAKRLPKMSEILHDAQTGGKLRIVSGVYQLDSGRFELSSG
ncbi:MAG: carbonic anhydrase [Myxococcota bacterium]